MVLSACAPSPPAGFRDTDRPIGATARFDKNAFSGDWLIVSRFEAPASGRITFGAEGDTLQVSSDAVPIINGPYREGVPGELLPLSEAQEPLIVMWVDADFETAAIGTASGSFGAVIDRDGALPADRVQAARDILEFYGWDTSALQRMG